MITFARFRRACVTALLFAGLSSTALGQLGWPVGEDAES
jgi:hypothetical protein